MIYIIIFISKVIENTLGTLRLIIVANGKKIIGAILQFIIAIIWVLVTGLVITNLLNDPLKIIFFALGSFVGSYAGSLIEEKMALGNNILTIIIDELFELNIVKKLREQNFGVTVLKGKGKEKKRSVLLVLVPRKKEYQIIDIIKKIDCNCMIASGNVNPLVGGYNK